MKKAARAVKRPVRGRGRRLPVSDPQAGYRGVVGKVKSVYADNLKPSLVIVVVEDATGREHKAHAIVKGVEGMPVLTVINAAVSSSGILELYMDAQDRIVGAVVLGR
jgi:hypothetical protein